MIDEDHQIKKRLRDMYWLKIIIVPCSIWSHQRVLSVRLFLFHFTPVFAFFLFALLLRFWTFFFCCILASFLICSMWCYLGGDSTREHVIFLIYLHVCSCKLVVITLMTFFGEFCILQFLPEASEESNPSLLGCLFLVSFRNLIVFFLVCLYRNNSITSYKF